MNFFMFSVPLIPTLPPYPSQVDKFVKYLRRVVPVLLEEEDDVPETFNKALQDRQYLENIKKFISDPQVRGKATASKYFRVFCDFTLNYDIFHCPISIILNQ